MIAEISDKNTGEALPGVIIQIKNTEIVTISNSSGIAVLNNIPNGKHFITFKILGYMPFSDFFNFPQLEIDTFFIKLSSLEEEIIEIEVLSTRSSRSIKDEPSRVEFIAGEELEEKANMKPGDIRMLLAESTGIQTQQTSATSANSSIRIQGLDGRYTQILKDGFPLYSGFSGSLGLLQTPPLDLKQAEVIKGSTSTLYGGGAIAGMVNLISKTPEKEGELKVFLNGTTAKGLDLNGYYGKKFKKTGITIYAARNSNEAYKTANNDFTAIPKFTRYTLSPRFYYYPNNKLTLILGISAIEEKRKGGIYNAITGGITLPEYYFESNATNRYATTFETNYKIRQNSIFRFKTSYSYFKRKLNQMFYSFEGSQNNFFSELTFSKILNKSEWIVGINYLNEKFIHHQISQLPDNGFNLSYEQNTAGVFIQNIYKFNKKLLLESGLRNDFIIDYGNALLPRVSLLYKINPVISSRIGSGLGYKMPGIFTESSERILFENLKTVSPESNKLEKSYGFNGDINYRTYFEKSKISLNTNLLLFYTRINSPLLLQYFQNPLIVPYYALQN